MDHGDGQEPPLVGFGGTAGKWGITPIERQESGDRSRSRGERVGHARQPDVEMSVVGGDPIAPERRDRGHKSSKRRKKKKKQKENNGEVNPAYSHGENGENRNSDDVETLQNHNRTPQTLPPITGAQPTHAGPPPRQPLPRKQDAHEDVIVPIDVEELQRCDVVDTGGGQNSRWNNIMGSLLGLGGGEERQSATHLDQDSCADCLPTLSADHAVVFTIHRLLYLKEEAFTPPSQPVQSTENHSQHKHYPSRAADSSSCWLPNLKEEVGERSSSDGRSGSRTAQTAGREAGQLRRQVGKQGSSDGRSGSRAAQTAGREAGQLRRQVGKQGSSDGRSGSRAAQTAGREAGQLRRQVGKQGSSDGRSGSRAAQTAGREAGQLRRLLESGVVQTAGRVPDSSVHPP
ncbi:Hypp4999 [Branchiostoma lanceolatum]|uniref:Hypp4999 protein n=1 Tax=Branchiostoma lanceolatum TaxID=7740 RepID=A0A8K0ABI6_BRALA|nr:Hypp4999 [Branchiostoma lanceolatum]